MEDLPFEIAETAHALRKAFDRRASALGVTRAQWKVLFRLTRLPGMRQVELADMLEVEPITSVADRRSARGSRPRRAVSAIPTDRRAWRLQATEQAKPLVEKLKVLGSELVGEAFVDIDPSELERMRGVLARVRENVAAAALQRGEKAAEA